MSVRSDTGNTDEKGDRGNKGDTGNKGDMGDRGEQENTIEVCFIAGAIMIGISFLAIKKLFW